MGTPGPTGVSERSRAHKDFDRKDRVTDNAHNTTYTFKYIQTSERPAALGHSKSNKSNKHHGSGGSIYTKEFSSSPNLQKAVTGIIASDIPISALSCGAASASLSTYGPFGD